MSITPDRDEHINQSESSPLLQQQQQHQDDFSTRDSRVQGSSPSTNSSSSSWLYVIILCGISMIVIDIGGYLFQYFKPTKPENIPERLCKIDAVQDEMAMILGWQVLFDNLPGILLAIPYCTLADKYGRKWILVLNFAGIAMDMAWILLVTGATDLPIRFTWLGSAFLIAGGGGQVSSALLFTIIADVVPIAQRSTLFFYMTAVVLVLEFIAAPISSLLMEYNVWLPLVVGLISQILGVLIATALPETLPPPTIDATNPLVTDETVEDSRKSIKAWKKIKENFEFLLRDKSVAFLVIGFLVLRLGRQSMSILLQYVSKRYDWSLSQANLLLSLRAGVNLGLLIVILPVVSASMLKRVTPTVKDVWISRGSILLLTLGSVVLGVSINPTFMVLGLIIYTLGTGYPASARSLVTTLVGVHDSSSTSDIARLYAFIAIADGIGSLIAGPSLSYAFHLGLKLGGNWTGLPFLFAAFMFIVAGLPVFVTKFVSKTVQAEDGVRED